MALLRLLLVVVAVAVVLLAALYFISGERRYLGWAMQVFKGGVALGLVFFAVLLIERLWAA